MKKLCCPLTVILAIAIAGLLYIFMIKGETVAGNQNDPRTAIVMTAGERAMVLEEMRTLLTSVQTITLALTSNDMDGVATAARKVGLAAQGEMPPGLVKKLPMAFKKLGFGTHQAFDQLALDAESFGDKEQTLEALGKLMSNCVGCHAAFQIKTAEE